MHPAALLRGRVGLGESVFHQQQEQRGRHKQNERVARQPIREPLRAGRLQVFQYRHCPEVAGAPPIQITGSRMMGRVFPSPVLVRGEGQQAGDHSQNVVGLPGFEKRAVPAIVKNDEDPHEKRSRQDRQRHRDPPGHGQTEIHQIPESCVGNQCVDRLPECPNERRLLVLDHKLLPGRRVCLAFAPG
jgi:hypothetical protein